MRFTTNKGNNYVFGSPDSIDGYPLTHSYVFDGPVTNMRIRM
jgi:hypothetical protein